MQLKTIFFLLVLFSLLPGKSFSQDHFLRQWQANYAFTNPAFTGISVKPRVNFSFSNYFPRIVDGQNNYELHYDQQLSPKTGYIGASVNYFNGSLLLKRYVGSLQYAYEFDLSNEMKLRTGTSISVVHLNIDSSKIIGASGGKSLVDRTGAHIGLGALFTYKNTFIGLSCSNFTPPLTARNGTTGKPVLMDELNAQAGGFFPLNKSNDKSVIIAPYLNLYGITKNWAFAPGVNINKGIFTGGISYRAHRLSEDILALTIGVSKGWIKTGLSYDYGLPYARSVSRSVWTGSSSFTLTVYPGKLSEESNNGLLYYFRKMEF